MLIRFFLPLCLVLFLVPAAASGFMPSFETVRSGLHGQLESLKNYQVDLVPAGDRSLLIRHWQEGPLWRQEWVMNPETERATLLLAAVGQGRMLSASFPEYRSIPVPFVSLWHPLSRAWWDEHRIDTRVMSYQFLEERPSLVIGAVYGQTRAPQLWVDNERFTLLRLLTPEHDLRWSDYQRIGNHWLPKAMVVAFPDMDPMLLEISWRGVNTAMTQDRFSKESFAATYAGQRSLQYVPSTVRPLFDRFPQAVRP